MKPTQNLLILVMLLYLATGLQSCKKTTKENDSQSPSFVVLQPNSSDQFSIGSELTIVTTFHDYVELSSYSIIVNWNTDAQNISPNPDVYPWDYIAEETISGHNFAINKTIVVPENIRLGYYDLILYCFDKTDNKVSKILTIKIVN